MDSCWQPIDVSSFIRLQNYVKHFYLYLACKTTLFIWVAKLFCLLNFHFTICECNVKLGGQPATPAHMGRRVRRAADPYEKQGGRRAGSRPKRTKSGRNRRPFGSARWSCFNGFFP